MRLIGYPINGLLLNTVFYYILSGGIGAFINIAGLYILTDIIGLWYIFSGIISFLSSAIVTFTMQKILTFKDKTSDDLKKKFLYFLCISIFNLIINTILLFVLTEKLHLYYIFSQILSGLIVATWTFFVYKKFVFKTTSQTFSS